jgi:hypothetical protein
MAYIPPDEDMETTLGPSRTPGGLQDRKDQEEESSEREEEEKVTLDLQLEGTEVIECSGECKECEPCGSEDYNALEELHPDDEEEVLETESWS